MLNILTIILCVLTLRSNSKAKKHINQKVLEFKLITSEQKEQECN